MANVFNIIDDVVRDTEVILSDQLILPRLVSRRMEEPFQSGMNKGSEIRIAVPPDLGFAENYDDFGGGNVAITDAQDPFTRLKIEKHFTKSMTINTAESQFSLDSFEQQYMFPMVRSIVQSVNDYFISGIAAGFMQNRVITDGSTTAGIIGTVGTPSNSLESYTRGIRTIKDGRAGRDPSLAMINLQSEESLRLNNFFVNADYSVGDEGPESLRTGMLAKRQGLNWFPSNRVNQVDLSNTAGTVTVKSTVTASESVTLTGLTSTSTLDGIKAGTRLTVDSVVFVVLRDADIDGSGDAIVYFGPYQLITATAADGVTITDAGNAPFKDTIWNPAAVVGAVIAPNNLSNETGLLSRIITVDDVSMRMTVQSNINNLSQVITLDTFCGVNVLRPEWGIVVNDLA